MDEVTSRRAWALARADLFDGCSPSSSPVLLSVGAQPGAGKTQAIDAVMRELYPGEPFVKVIGDDLRQFHPDFPALSRSADPEAMPAATAELSGWLVGQALAYAAEHGYSAVVEGTLRRPETTLGTLTQFAKAGARTHLVALGVSAFDSWTGCIDRYLSALETGRAARWTPLAAHDAGLMGTPQTLRAAASSPNVHRLSIVDRAGAVHYDNLRGDDGEWMQPERAVEVLTELRNRTGDSAERLARVDSLVERAGALKSAPVVREGIAHALELTETRPVRSKADVLGQIAERSKQLRRANQSGLERPSRRPEPFNRSR
ncbi:MAG: zeta toxin family protein [Actinomyces succiniciruminis]|nr:zeta toxin family protein [Actinomyces succiniciruminis]